MILLHTLLHYYTFLIYFLSFNVNFFNLQAKGRLSAENAKTDSTSEFHTKFDEGDETESTRESRRIELEELSRDPDVYDKLTVSVAVKKRRKGGKQK